MAASGPVGWPGGVVMQHIIAGLNFAVILLTPALQILTSRLVCRSKYIEGFLKVVPRSSRHWFSVSGMAKMLVWTHLLGLNSVLTCLERVVRQARSTVFWVLMCVNCNVKLLISHQ